MDARSSAKEEGTLVVAALGGAKGEADLPGVIDNLGILRVPLGPKGIHGANTGLVLLSHVVEDTRGPLTGSRRRRGARQTAPTPCPRDST